MKRFSFGKQLIACALPPKDINVLWVDTSEGEGKAVAIKEFNTNTRTWDTILQKPEEEEVDAQELSEVTSVID